MTTEDDAFVFTQEIRERLENNDIPLNQVQFYLNSTIILERTVSSDSAAVTSGKVILENGVFKNRILIPAQTPGIFKGSISSYELDVSFEENNSLPFSINSDGEYVFSPSGLGEDYSVRYDNETYVVRLGAVEVDGAVEIESLSTTKGYRILDDGSNNFEQGNYYMLADSPASIKLELKKSEFDEFNLETRTVEGLRVQ